VRLGWSHGDQEVFSIDQMIELFDVMDVNKSASSFNPEKLLWLNQQYIKESSPVHVARHLSHHIGLLGIDPAQDRHCMKVVKAQQERAKTLVEDGGQQRVLLSGLRAVRREGRAEESERGGTAGLGAVA